MAIKLVPDHKGCEAKMIRIRVEGELKFFVQTPTLCQSGDYDTEEKAATAWNSDTTYYNSKTHSLISHEAMNAWKIYLKDMRPETRNDFLRLFFKETENKTND